MSSETNKAFKNANIIDFKYVIHGGPPDELVIPFDVHRLTASVLVSEKVKEDITLRDSAFLLAFKVDGRVALRMKPADIS